jgi:glutamate synthase (NADPH/NADH)
MLTRRRGINEGRQSAREVDLYLEKSTGLPVTGGIVKLSAQEILGPAPSLGAPQVVVAAAS